MSVAATTKKPSLATKIAWSRAKRLAAIKGISVADARKILKEDPEALARLEYSAEKLAEKEAELIKQYPQIQKGTLKFNVDGVHKNKLTVVIRCSHPGCNEKREIATSDLHQVTMCEEHTKAARNERRRAAYAANHKKAKKVKAKA